MEGNVYVSLDEGKSWNRATGIPPGEASMVIEHPADNKYVSTLIIGPYICVNFPQAYTLTPGKIHYRTEDRGRTWRPFEVPLPPAKVARPLSFHSDPKNYGYILYQGTDCDRFGFGSVCHDEASSGIVLVNAF